MPIFLLSSRSARGRAVALVLAATFVGAAVASVARAQAPAMVAARTPASAHDPQPIARAVEAVGFTVADMYRAIEF